MDTVTVVEWAPDFENCFPYLVVRYALTETPQKLPPALRVCEVPQSWLNSVDTSVAWLLCFS